LGCLSRIWFGLLLFRNAANRVDIPKELYGAEQRNDEDAISWSCRLEDIIGHLLVLVVICRWRCVWYPCVWICL
jgi:hypothetical protein